VTDSPESQPTKGKGHATPSRKEREAANQRPLVPKRQAMTKEDRRKKAAERTTARAGYEAGDERYLPVRDKGPQRRYVRDYVDAKYTVGEFMIPIMFAGVVVTFLPNFGSKTAEGLLLQSTLLIAVYGFLIIGIADVLIWSRKMLRLMGEKFGATNLEKGLRWYAGVRAFQFRPLRTPKPRVQRGQFPS